MRNLPIKLQKLLRSVFYQVVSFSKKKPAVAGALGVLVFVTMLSAIFTVGHNPPITALAIGDSTKIPDQNSFSTKSSVERGETLRIQMRYNPGAVDQLSVRILDKDKNEVIKTGSYSLNDHGEFSLAMSTAQLEPGDYKIEVLGSDNRRVAVGDLNVKPAAEKDAKQ